jgi:DNA-binding NarL/FixJ family response regulator
VTSPLLAEQNARLAERARISRELHDAISQDLFSLRMATGGLQTALAPCSQALELQPYIETLQEATTRMIREMRALLLELRPGQLEQLGLAAALEELAMAYRTRLSITVTTSFTPVQLDAKAEHALLRIAKESSPEEVVAAVRAAATGESRLHPMVAARLLREVQQRDRSPLGELTPRELEVLAQIARGRSSQEIATELSVSERTVKTHVSNILSKLHLADRTQAAIYALQQRLVPLKEALENE